MTLGTAAKIEEPSTPVSFKKKKHRKRHKITSQKSSAWSGKSLAAASSASSKVTTYSDRMVRKERAAKRIQDKLKMMFTSSIDPYDKPLEWWESPHVKYALSYKPVKSRVESLMGSCVVRLTDRKFMTLLMRKIREDHEAKQEARMQDRKWKELMRTKNMILGRFISIEEADAEILNYPLFQLYQYCDSLEKRRKKPTPRKVRISQSLFDLLYPAKPEALEEAAPEEIPMKEIIVDGEPKMVPLTPAEIEKLKDKEERKREIQNGYMLSKEDFDNLHYEAESVKKFKATKTVNEMYRRANDIVGALYSFGPDEKRKRCGVDDDALSLSSSKASKGADSYVSQKSSYNPSSKGAASNKGSTK